MKESVLIVEDQFIEAQTLQLILTRAGYNVCGIAKSVDAAVSFLETSQPTLVLVDILLQGKKTGIDLARILQTKNIALNFNYDESVLGLNLQMEKRKNFYLIFKEAINNLVKYSKADQAKINVSQDQKFITMTVADNGTGFNADKEYNGNGLINTKQRAEEINATLNIQSAVGEGTTIELKLRSR